MNTDASRLLPIIRQLIIVVVAVALGVWAGFLVWPGSEGGWKNHPGGMSGRSQENQSEKPQRKPYSPASSRIQAARGQARSDDARATSSVQAFLLASRRASEAADGSDREKEAMREMAQAMRQFGSLSDDDRTAVAAAWQEFTRTRE